MASSQDKGRLLEEGVRAIERHLLSTEAAIADGDLTIESRKIVIEAGVRNEIDLHITLRRPHGYDAVFIFECKNWKDKVGKNELIVFSEKIKVSKAQRGFFMAPSFTDDARAQAALDQRVELVTATAKEIEDVQHVTNFSWMVVAIPAMHVDLRSATSDTPPPTVNPSSAHATLDGRVINFDEYVRQWAATVADQRTSAPDARMDDDGQYRLEVVDTRELGAGRLVIDGHAYAYATLHADVVATVTTPTIRARVDVVGRGRALKLEPIVIGDGTLEIWLTASEAP